MSRGRTLDNRVADLPTPLMANWLWYQWLDCDDDAESESYRVRLRALVSDPRCQPENKLGGAA